MMNEIADEVKSPRGRHHFSRLRQRGAALGIDEKARSEERIMPHFRRDQVTRDGSDDAERPPPWICFSPRPSATPLSCKPARATTRARARASSRSSTSTTARLSCAIPRSRSCRRLSSPRLRSRTRATSRPPRSTRAPRAGEHSIERDRPSRRGVGSAVSNPRVAAVVPRRPSGRETPEKKRRRRPENIHPIGVGRFVPPQATND